MNSRLSEGNDSVARTAKVAVLGGHSMAMSRRCELPVPGVLGDDLLQYYRGHLRAHADAARPGMTRMRTSAATAPFLRTNKGFRSISTI